MIFGKEYDIALSVILNSDKKNCEEIIGKIDEIPAELIKQILEADKILNEKGSFANMTEMERDKMSGLVKTKKGEYFSFNIDESDLSLCIRKRERSSDLYVNSSIYDLTLNRINYDKLKFVDFFEGTDIACYERGIIFLGEKDLKKGSHVHEIISDESSYSVQQNPFGWFVYINGFDKYNRVRTKVRMFSFEKILSMQDNIDVTSLDKMFLSKRKRRTRKK